MTGCYRLVRIIVVWYGQAPLPILGLDADAGRKGSPAGQARPATSIPGLFTLMRPTRKEDLVFLAPAAAKISAATPSRNSAGGVILS